MLICGKKISNVSTEVYQRIICMMYEVENFPRGFATKLCHLIQHNFSVYE
jgi:hypothetical protein